ncbi:zinc-ribbon domain-containing protein [Kiloniella sp.]|uniref:zinc-ribbon domain-containing protein n=1 Tax=Kiloniella sp. TaxID=1938587 RepID=UPI003B025170
MIVSCPECDGKFRVANDALGDSGRKVRCKSCRHIWFQTPEAEIELAPAIVEPSEEPQDIPESISPAAFDEQGPLDDDFVEPGKVRSRRPRGFAPEKVKKKGKGLLVGWVLFFVLAGGLGYGFWNERVLIVRTLPQAMNLYDLLGLDVFLTGEGLEIENQKTERATKDGKKLIVLSGDIANITEDKIVVPKIIGSLRASNGEALSRKTITPSVEYLEPSEKSHFLIELIASPDAILADVQFISDEEALQTPDFEPTEK